MLRGLFELPRVTKVLLIRHGPKAGTLGPYWELQLDSTSKGSLYLDDDRPLPLIFSGLRHLHLAEPQ